MVVFGTAHNIRFISLEKKKSRRRSQEKKEFYMM